MVSPSAFAVFRLITSSNFVGCSTGKSAGFAPQDFVDVNGGPSVQVTNAHAVAHQPPGFHKFF